MPATSTPGASSSTSKPEIPWAFHECPTETLVILISHMLNLLIQHNDQVILTPDSLTRFHSKSAPDIKVLDYLNRIVKYTNMEKIPLLSLLAYIDVTCTNNPTFTLSSLTVHRFLIAGVCAGSKAQCDVFCTNSHYAKVGGININELNALEMEFLKVTQWDLCCKAELLQRYYTSLIKSHGGFVQAVEPIDSPLKSLPHPKSPLTTTNANLPTSGDPVSASTAEEHKPQSSSGSQGPSFSRDPDPNSGPVDIPPPKRTARRDSDIDTQSVPERGETRPAGLSGTNSAPESGRMEIDDDISPPIDVDDPSSPASSSVPSSSRSSLRTRNVSMTQLDPSAVTAASPRIDMTTASGRVVMQVDEDGSGGVISPEPEQESKGPQHGSGSGGGKLLKSLVGGIFKRRDSAHHSDPPAPPAPPTQHDGNRNGNGNRLIPPHQSPGRRVKSPLMTTIAQGEPPAMAASVTPRVRNREETNGF